jgi:hypothetical protein
MTVLVDGTTGRAIVAPVGVCAVNDAWSSSPMPPRPD